MSFHISFFVLTLFSHSGYNYLFVRFFFFKGLFSSLCLFTLSSLFYIFSFVYPFSRSIASSFLLRFCLFLSLFFFFSFFLVWIKRERIGFLLGLCLVTLIPGMKWKELFPCKASIFVIKKSFRYTYCVHNLTVCKNKEIIFFHRSVESSEQNISTTKLQLIAALGKIIDTTLAFYFPLFLWYRYPDKSLNKNGRLPCLFTQGWK